MSSSTEQEQPFKPPKAGAFIAFRYGWRGLKRHFLELLIIVVLSFLASLPLSISTGGILFEESTFFTLGYIFFFLIPLQYGVDYAFLRAALNRQPRIGDLLEFFNNYLHIIIAIVLVHVFVSIGFLLLIVPGFIFMCKLAFVPYLVTYHQISSLDAIRLSWKMTRGYAWTIFRIWLTALPIYLLGIAVLGVGFIVSTMWVTLANAVLYYYVADQSEILDRFLSHRKAYRSRQSSKSTSSAETQEKGLPNLLDRE